MKLLTKTRWYLLVVSIGALITGGLVFYYTMNRIIDEEINEKLYAEKEQLLLQLQKIKRSNSILLNVGDHIGIDTLPSLKRVKTKSFIRDTILYDESEQEVLPFHQLVFYTNLEGKYYRITISRSHIESDDLFDATVMGILSILAGLLLCLYLLNSWVNRNIWMPFYRILDIIKSFDMEKGNIPNLPDTGIDEFNDLGREVKEMMKKIKKDYFSLKEFTENASHEIQTPLAVIKSKLELLMQNEIFNKEQMELIHSSYEAVNKLSRLNQSLILLTRISNRQFIGTDTIDLKELLEKKMENFRELAVHKNLNITTKLQENTILNINPSLAEILISNLLSNAIKHNIENGEINITLTRNKLEILNTGDTLYSYPPEKLFERFRKKDGNESLGLGLAIVKQICDNYSIHIDYFHENNKHKIVLTF